METRFRTMLFRMIEAGWEIDYAKVEAEWDRKVYVIPSPERRKDPKNWVHEAVPMTRPRRSEEHTSELQSLMRISYAVFCLKQNYHHMIQITKTSETDKSSNV